MANVFTKKYQRPRTTTLSDYSAYQWIDTQDKVQQRLGDDLRVLSPTRRCNPHPTGLVSQKPYNKDNTTFAIWNPNFSLIGERMPNMISHLERSNFSSGPVLPPVQKRDPPKIKYTVNSISRLSYQRPAELPAHYRHLAKTTRFGYTPYNPAQGIVPNTLPPIYSPLPK